MNSEIGPRLTDVHLVDVVVRVPLVLRLAVQLRPPLGEIFRFLLTRLRNGETFDINAVVFCLLLD